ncbi:hypothetical protein PR202_gb12100 [Eleusine coracana subsp. coracana]|uniref:At1g61320/AtMIF1 LRR domain-containing protein n=1 Tax=Eleusine coracana subsp. coracana TaxID=191504 RepID=A0AAV5ENN8_ELECO|nr:hypothetical protein PR202_gb12100 [Eleusine coracana subsp. coracana]
MQDAARAACVSRELLRSWRYYPELEFSAKTLSLDEHTSIKSQMAKGVIRRIDDTLQNRAGIWVKRLKFKLGFFCKLRACYINQWLDAAATFGLEELTLELPRNEKMKYKFPCKLFFGEKECSMQSLCLYACAFPTEHGSCSFRSLKRVEFRFVHITTEESLVFLSSSLVLEHLEIGYCHEIFCLRIPCTLQLLNVLRVERCSMLETIESDAPNLSTFHYEGPIIQFLLEDTLQLKDVEESSIQKSHLVIDPSTLVKLVKLQSLQRHCHKNIKHDTGTRDYQEWQNNFSNPEEFLRRTYPDVEAYLAHIAIGRYIIGRLLPSVDLKSDVVSPDQMEVRQLGRTHNNRKHEMIYLICRLLSCDI